METATEEKGFAQKLRRDGRRIALKFDGICADCGTVLPKGTTARWYGRGRVYGLDCHEKQVKTESEGVVTYSPPPIQTQAPKLRALADGLTDKIEALFADRRQNTPKQQQQAGYARLNGIHLKRTQEALYALVSLYEAGDVPIILQKFRSKAVIHEAMKSKMDGGNHGYYSVPVDLGEPASSNREDIALWALIKGQTEEEKKEEELTRKINGLKFSNIPGYFPTPEPVIEMMIERADIGSDHAILEPSAGSGAIADAIEEYMKGSDWENHHEMGIYEINHTLQGILEAKGYRLQGDDFTEADPICLYDRILMNPPFENSQDISHVYKAFSLLTEGGRLVSIMSPGPFFREDKKSTEFRQWFDDLGGEVVDLPENSFKESGTGVATKLIILDKE